jgi:putative spermidine/putrescine transport system ATP-binding protein
VSAIELDGITKHYGSVRAVDGISCTIGQGEFVTILGPSGAGKTTLLNLIAGLIQPNAGCIRIDGHDVTRLAAARRNIGLVFQSYALFPNMTVYGNVAFPLEVRSVPRAEIERKVKDALQLVRLGGLETRRPDQLSGGQQQRVALARSIVFQPAILLLDEPLAALDRKLRDEVRLELRRVQRELDVTTILVTHDQDEALSLSDRLLVVSDGKVQQEGPPEELYLRPSSLFVADFLGAANLIQGTIRLCDGETRIAIKNGGGTMPAQAPGCSDGDEVCLLVRPERLSLTAEGAPNAPGLSATVTGCVYLGQSVRYHLELASGRELVAAATDRVPRFAPGVNVVAGWEPADVWLIPDGAVPSAAMAAPAGDM